MIRFVALLSGLLACVLGAQTLPQGWSGSLELDVGPGSWALEIRPQAGEFPLVALESRTRGGDWRWKADNRSPTGVFLGRVEFASEDPVRLVITEPLSSTLVCTLRSVGFSALTGALKKTLSQGLSQSTPLKLRVASQPPWPFTFNAAALDREGKVWAALITGEQLVRLWSPERKLALGPPLDLGGQTIASVTFTFDTQNRAVVVLQGSKGTPAKAFSWTGKAWAREALPEAAGGPPFTLTADSRLRGWLLSDAGWVLAETPWQSPGFGRPVQTKTVATAPGALDAAVLTGDFGAEVAFWNPGDESPLRFWNEKWGWRTIEVPANLTAAALSTGTSVLHVWDNAGAAKLWQFDGQDWRVPLPLSSLAPGDARAWTGFFLAPNPSARSGLLILARGAGETHLDVWELP